MMVIFWLSKVAVSNYYRAKYPFDKEIEPAGYKLYETYSFPKEFLCRFVHLL